MKLIVCPPCSSIFNLKVGPLVACPCGKSWGRYTDDLNAEIGGEAIPLGFANGSFIAALRQRPVEGDGAKFDAFVIPIICSSVVRTGEAPRETNV